MHPWGWHHHYHRGGRRLVWFAFGAAAATWWHHAKTRTEAQGGFGCTWRHRRELEALRAAGSGEAPPPELERWAWQFKHAPLPPPPQHARSVIAPVDPSTSDTPTPASAPNMSAHDWEAVRRERWARENARAATEWDEEKERMREFAQRAEEKITDVSEATLESILTTVETLKAKLAEHRAQKAAAAEKEKALQEEARNSSSRWV